MGITEDEKTAKTGTAGLFTKRFIDYCSNTDDGITTALFRNQNNHSLLHKRTIV